MGNHRRKKKKSSQRIWIIILSLILIALVITVGVIVAIIAKSDHQEESKNVSYSQGLSRDTRQRTSTTKTQWQEETQESSRAPEITTTEKESYLDNLSAYEAGSVLTEEMLDPDHMEEYFTSSEISSDIFSRIKGLSYKSYCTVPKSDLRYIKLLHYNFDHEIQVGELIVNVKLEKDMLEIFQELFELEYEIEKMYLVDNYDADDTKSIEHNNTSCFNFRRITNGSKLSNHAGGCAIDINPQQNPYVTFRSDGSKHWVHANAELYIDRNGPGDHMINHQDDCYKVFSEHGFTWGGDWKNPKDYQHFEKKVAYYD